jgi:serine/threonine protein kinase
VAGTLPYMSPEQTDGVRDDPRVDVYALGAVLYRMLTGRTYLEFDQRETPRAQVTNVERICSEQPAPPSTHGGHIPAWLDEVVLKALAKQPADRYASADELRDAMLQQGKSASLLPSGLAQTTASPQPPSTPPVSQPEAADNQQAVLQQGRPLSSRFSQFARGSVVLLVMIAIGLMIFLGTRAPLSSSTPGPRSTAAPNAERTFQPTPVPTKAPKLQPTPLPTVASMLASAQAKGNTPPAGSGQWYWRGQGPFRAQNGAIGFENYADRELVIRIDGLGGTYRISAEKGAILGIEVPLGQYDAHVWADQVQLPGCWSGQKMVVQAGRALVMSLTPWPTGGFQASPCRYEDRDQE